MSDDGRADNGAEKNSIRMREHHNFAERKRRDMIKDSFTDLKDTVPTLRDETPVSRAKILRKAAEYIQHMKKRNESHQQDIDNLNRQNDMLEYQINQSKRVKNVSKYTVQHSNLAVFVSESDNTDKSEEDLQKTKTE
ncbi:protein max-like, partial [Metopolophium dirhodum]|uniref:protein max-like n=1 Tax=Metopolophium dirhodum TaxID=44670 RepID=UPI002990394F